MDKKWFVYLGNRHEGPFSVEELSGQMGTGKLSQQTYVWAEGMPDWQPMTTLSAFKNLRPEGREILAGNAKQGRSIRLPDGESSAGMREKETLQEELNHLHPSSDSHHVNIEEKFRKSLLSSPFETQTSEDSPPVEPKKRPFRLVILGVSILSIIVLNRVFDVKFNSLFFQDTSSAIRELTLPHLLSLSSYFPKLQEWFSPIPAIDQMDPSEYEELKAAARTKLEKGPRVALAVSQRQGLSPTFYVASNLPDGTVFKVYAIGNPHTLLNHLSFINSFEVKISQKLGQTPPIRFSDGKPIPKGEYTLYLVPGENQPSLDKTLLETMPSVLEKNPDELQKTAKIIAIKKYFLAGKQDNAYQARLKDYHDKVRTRASAEIADIKQFLATLENQMNETASKYALLHKGPLNSKKHQIWENFHEKWVNFENQLNTIFQKWTPEVVREQFFYGSLFSLTSQAGQALDRLHGYQHSYFDDNEAPNTLDAQVSEASSLAQNALKTLRAKVEQMEKIPPSVDGLPQREGL